MFRKKATIEQSNQDEKAYSREKIDVTLRKLQALKDKISEIRHQCEELRKQVSANKVFENRVSENKVSENKASLCNQCGNAIEPNQEVVVKDSAGIERRHYHAKCFQALLR
jgi:chromosome segregation ATPase